MGSYDLRFLSTVFESLNTQQNRVDPCRSLQKEHLFIPEYFIDILGKQI